MTARWRLLAALSLAELLSLSLWFSASAIVPQLTSEWGLGPTEQSWLTVSVQLGFVTGALLSALANLADRVPAQRVFVVGALLGAIANAAIALLRPGFGLVLGLRFVTGACLAGVYPPAMKLVVSWFPRSRGLAIGTLVGATTAGSALPHLFAVLPIGTGAGGLPEWPVVIYSASAAAALGALIVGVAVRPGPWLPHTSQFAWRQAFRGFSETALRRANCGYLGHMWELYAMWTWVPLYLLEAFAGAGLGPRFARLLGFGVVGLGAVGCVVAGLLADRHGRTMVTSVSMAVSAACALTAGFLAGSPTVLAIVCLVWGFAVVADSAQFSAAISELSDAGYVGTALTMQTAVGFLLTNVTIWLVPTMASRWGWGPAFAVLAVGPALGVVAMLRLRSMTAAMQIAGGRK